IVRIELEIQRPHIIRTCCWLHPGSGIRQGFRLRPFPRRNPKIFLTPHTPHHVPSHIKTFLFSFNPGTVISPPRILCSPRMQPLPKLGILIERDNVFGVFVGSLETTSSNPPRSSRHDAGITPAHP